MSFKHPKAFLLLCLLGCLSFCASVKAPEGGPKDTNPPKLVSSVPISKSVSFSGKSISLEFNEEVLENAPKRLFLSPITTVTVIDGSKRIRITPDSGFEPNTTYNLQLKNKIKDSREGILLKDTSIIFSTGSYIDSLSLSTQVITITNEISHKPTLIIISKDKKKQYFSVSDSLGVSNINNIPSEKYKIEAFQDLNENYQYDEEDKNLYYDSIKIDSSSNYEIKLLPHKSSQIRLFKQRKDDTISIESQDMVTLSGQIMDSLIYKSPQRLAFRFLRSISKTVLFDVTDSLGTCLNDTVLSTIDSSRSFSTMPLERTVSINGIAKKLQIVVSFSWRIDAKPMKVEIKYDSVWRSVPFKILPFLLSFDLSDARIGKLLIRYDTISFFNKTGYQLDSIEISKQDLEERGSVSGEIESNCNQPIVSELLDANKKQIALSTSQKFLFLVKPGKYTMQCFVDWNGDGIYTGGNRKLGRKGEPLFLYPKSIELKPGWDIENLKIIPGFK